MLKLVMWTTAFILAGGQMALACGSNLGEIKPGNKVVGIEIKAAGQLGTEGKGPSKWLMDDDGILALSLAASHCYTEVPRAEVKLTEAQYKCARDAQYEARIKMDDEIQFYFFRKDYADKTAAQEVLKSKCGIDAMALWNEANEKVRNEPLKCVQDVRGIVKKAVARNAEYIKEQTEPRYLAKLNLTSDQVKELVAVAQADQAQGKKLVDMLSSTPVKRGDFMDWADDFMKSVESHGYQKVDSPDEKFNAQNQTSLQGILMDIGSPLPGIAHASCGPGFPMDLIERMKPIIWEPRGSEQGTQGGTGRVKR